MKPLVAWPETRLSTLIATHLGLTKYGDLPSPTFSNYAFFITPIAYLFLFDLKSITAFSCRHRSSEGRILKDFRAACRRFFGRVDEELDALLVRLGDIWLAFTGVKIEDGSVEDESLDALVEEAFDLHTIMSKKLLSMHAEARSMPTTAKRVFLSAGDVLDGRLPVHLRQAAAAAEKAEAQHLGRLEVDGGGRKRGRFDDGAAGRFQRKDRPEVPSDMFWCHACGKAFPKNDSGHRSSEAHLEAAKRRK